jgi:hypothetical protein
MPRRFSLTTSEIPRFRGACGGAYWVFDQHDRLIDIFVDKKNGLY